MLAGADMSDDDDQFRENDSAGSAPAWGGSASLRPRGGARP
jgi:hypothetical protein